MKARKAVAIVLFPITMWYGIIVALRNWLYDIGFLRQNIHPVVTIGIGNLAVGGTGKTPMADYLLSLFGSRYGTALLSRGYRRKSKGFLCHEADTPFEADLCQALGDEPAMLSRRHPEVTVAVSNDRSEGLRQLLSLPNPPQLVVLDDVFQHRKVKPTMSILLTEYGKPYYSDSVLPYGRLREPAYGRYRANIIVVTKSPRNLSGLERHVVVSRLKAYSYQKIFFSYIEYQMPRSVVDDRTFDLAGVKHVLCVTGIANAEPLLAELRCGGRHVEHLSFPDHHGFTDGDVARIRERFEAMDGEEKVIVTTEKDRERLMLVAGVGDLPIYYIPICIAFHDENGMRFDDAIGSMVKENISFLERMKRGTKV